MLYRRSALKARGGEARMQKRERKTVTLNVTEARQQFSQLLNQVYRGEVRVVIEKNGIPVAALMSFRDLEWFDQRREQWDKDFEVLHEIGELFKDVPEEELEHQVAKAVAEARRELREEKRQGETAA
jgi:prevent-host-death family protein